MWFISNATTHDLKRQLHQKNGRHPAHVLKLRPALFNTKRLFEDIGLNKSSQGRILLSFAEYASKIAVSPWCSKVWLTMIALLISSAQAARVPTHAVLMRQPNDKWFVFNDIHSVEKLLHFVSWALQVECLSHDASGSISASDSIIGVSFTGWDARRKWYGTTRSQRDHRSFQQSSPCWPDWIWFESCRGPARESPF